jgi:hypothetical protein
VSTTSSANELRPTEVDIVDAGMTRVIGVPTQAQTPQPIDTSSPSSYHNGDVRRLPLVPPVRVPSPSRPQARFEALQKWEGRVLDVTDSTFTAIVVDGMVSGVEEEVEFDLDEVTPGDLDLVVPGAVFYWSIGYRAEPSGERSRSSVLVFRRLPVWSEKRTSTEHN